MDPYEVKEIRFRDDEGKWFPYEMVPGYRSAYLSVRVLVNETGNNECYVAGYVVEVKDKGQALKRVKVDRSIVQDES